MSTYPVYIPAMKYNLVKSQILYIGIALGFH